MARRRSRAEEGPQISGIPQWIPSSPKRPGQYVVKCEGPTFHILTFAHPFAAKKLIEAYVGGEEYDRDEKTIVTERLTITSEQLDEIMACEYNEAMQAWELPQQYKTLVATMRGTYADAKREVAAARKAETARPQPTATAAAVPKKKAGAARRKEVGVGMVTAEMLAEQLSVKGSVFRSVLRKLKLEKPEGGWQWPTSEAEKVKAQVVKGLKK